MRWEIRTRSGSVYVMDDEARTIARVTGEGQPTPRVGEGARRYSAVSRADQFGGPTGGSALLPPVEGRAMLIWWGEHATVPAAHGAEPVTITSVVTSVRALTEPN